MSSSIRHNYRQNNIWAGIWYRHILNFTTILDPFSNRNVIPYFHKFLVFYFILLNVFICTYAHNSYIIFANRKDIRQIDESIFQSSSPYRNSRSYNVTILIDKLEDATAVDFDFEENLLFWTDLGFETIKRFDLNDHNIHDVITTGIESPESLACDWITKKLYWVDSETNRIETSNYDGNQRAVLFWKDMDQPRTIVLVPSKGIMFWSDWGETPKIERASMDGDHSTRTIIISKEISWPNGLTVDYETERLYFADARREYIASCDFNGKNLRTINSNISQIFSLTLHGDFLYWTKMQNIPNNQYGIHYCDRNTGSIGTPYLTSDQSLRPLGITVFSSDRQPKFNSSCQINNGGCSHLCLLSSNSARYSCACPTGIKLQPDGKTCLPSPQKLLLLARRLDIRRISLDTNDYTPVVLPIRNMKHGVTLDYDPIEGKVYWSDDELRVIRRAKLDGTENETIISTDIIYPDGVAIDWVARNIYWTDAAIDHIEVARLDGSSRKVLISDNMDQPRAIVVHPLEGLIFWSDWGQGRIERASMDGSDRITIINSSLSWPNGLAIDYELSHIYWCDAKTKQIEMSRFDGSNRTRILISQASHMYSLTLIDEWIYWTDWTKRTVERAHKMTGNDITVVIENLPDLMGLKAVSANKPTGTNPCAENNGGCSHLCFNRPHHHYVCGCPGGYEMNADQKTCKKAPKQLYLLRETDVRKISLETKTMQKLSIFDMESASSFDLDLSGNRIYWTDPKNKMILRSDMNGSRTEIIVKIGLKNPRNLALDWISDNLYWVDIELKRIEVAKSNGSFRRIILHDRISHPYSLTVNPIDGYLFWTDSSGDSSRIFSSYLDGLKKKNIANSDGKIITLTVDYHEKRLYWINKDFNKITSSYFDGSSKKDLSFTSPSEPISLAIDEDLIYFLTRKSITIISKNGYLNQSLFEQDESFSTANQILIMDRKGWNLCADHNGGCEHLCFVRPSQKHDPNIHCSCASHYTLDNRDRSEDKRCLPPEKFLLYSEKNLVVRFLFDSKSNRGDFQDIILPITNLKNIKTLAYDQLDHYIYVIDGKSIKRISVDGHSGTETVVDGHSHNVQPMDLVIDPYARILFWTCNITNSINVTRIIGRPTSVGSVHHTPYDRPHLLAYHIKTNALFWTNHNGPRIERISFPYTNKTTVVDGSNGYKITALAVDQELDFLIWFNEIRNVIEISSLDGSSGRNLFKEMDAQMISIAAYEKYLFWIERDTEKYFIKKMSLDLNRGKNEQIMFFKDVQDHILTDIIAVPQMFKSSSHLYCNNENGGCSHFCFMTNHSGSFACDCPQGLMLSNEEPPRKCVDKIECLPNQFQCKMGKCILASLRCNHISECQDGSDESDCPTCLQGQLPCFRNNEVTCLDKTIICDGDNNCAGDFDKFCCEKDYFRCQRNNCIPKNQLCDGKTDCLDGEDEDSQQCQNSSSTKKSGSSARSFSYISYIVIIVSLILIIYFVYFHFKHCPRYCFNKDDKEVGTTEILMVERPPSTSGLVLNNRSPIKKSNGILSAINGKLDCNTLTTTTTISGLDTLQPEIHFNKPIITVNPLISGSTMQTESLIERNVTGASSTSSSTNINTYPREAINPPPSPATERSQCSSLSSSLFVPRPRPRNMNGMFNVTKNRKKGYKKKLNNKSSSNRCPPPTPCSTDVYEDIEPCPIKYVFYDNTQTDMDDYDYKPPPPTPRNYFSDPSCPPSPVTERSYCNPYPPPPSPVQDYE